MNIPRDFLRDRLTAESAEELLTAPPAAAWRAAEARLRRYVDLLDPPQGEALREEALRRAQLRLRYDPTAQPLRVVLEEFHWLLGELKGGAPSAIPARDSVVARLRKWSGGEPVLRSAPPIRLGHMAPEKYSADKAAARRRSVSKSAEPSYGMLVRTK